MQDEKDIYIVKKIDEVGNQWRIFKSKVLSRFSDTRAIVSVPHEYEGIFDADSIEVEYGKSCFDDRNDALGALKAFIYAYADSDCFCEFIDLPEKLKGPCANAVRLAVVYPGKPESSVDAEKYILKAAKEALGNSEKNHDAFLQNPLCFFPDSDYYDILNIEVVSQK